MMDYRPVATPPTAEDFEDMFQCLNQAQALGVILSRLDDTDTAVDVWSIIDVGKLLKNLMAQPIEVATELSREKRDAAEKTAADN